MAAVIETEGLTKRYGAQVAVNRLNLTVPEGAIFGFLGPNGAGKTTTILMLLGLSEPTAGKARVLGLDPVREPLKVKRQVGYLPESVGFYDDLSARENLRYIAALNNLAPAEAGKRIDEALATVELADQGDKPVGAYSHGMRQRLGIAELLVKNPKLLILDEPTVGLDPDGTNKMLDLIVSLNRDRGITVMLSSHLLNQVQRICSHVGIMNRGELVASGTLQELTAGKEGQDLESIYLTYFKEA
ncbi:MAG: ABC transporter ATP-binding protein [Verrucomicrobia bacterium]|nr:MAG: ABC transporter ATP-binding protein [Verrucomicrobiota bacterium]